MASLCSKQDLNPVLNMMPQCLPSVCYLETMILDRPVWLTAIQLFGGCWRSKMLERTSAWEAEARAWSPLPARASRTNLRVTGLFSYILGWRCLSLLLLLLITIIIAANTYWSLPWAQPYSEYFTWFTYLIFTGFTDKETQAQRIKVTHTV